MRDHSPGEGQVGALPAGSTSRDESGLHGLPAAQAATISGLSVVGLGRDAAKVAALNTGSSHVDDTTPLRPDGLPDLDDVRTATTTVTEHLHPELLVVLESTTYPGTTEEVVQPILESTGMVVGRDFYLAYSPERIDQGGLRFTFRNTPKWSPA